MAARDHGRVVVGRWIAGVSVVAIAFATLLPEPGSHGATHWCLICGELSGVDSFLNVLLFVPLGIGLALAGVHAGTAIAGMFAFTVAIEASQLLIVAGRHASLGDVFTNTVGGIVGVVAGHYASGILKPRPAIALRLAGIWLGIWLGFQVLVAYALIPVPSDTPYYCHIGRPHWRSSFVFPGKVLSASIGSESLSPGKLANSVRLKSMLRDGAPLQVAVAAAGSSPARSEIVVVAGTGTGVISFEQEGADVIFDVRNGADALLLRPFEFRLRDVFRGSMAASSRDTIHLDGRYGRAAVVLRANSKGVVHERQFIPRLSYGWMLLAPYQPQIEGDAREALASAVFMAMLMLPAGYWGRLADQSPDESKKVRRGIVLFGVLAAGLVAVPTAFGLRPAAIWEWGSSITGIAIGIAIASRVLASTTFPIRTRGIAPQKTTRNA